jgi:hypothetical protein
MAANPMMIFAAVSAVGQLSAGAAQQEQYNAQAAQAQLKGRSEAIAYKQQGADVLKKLNENMATIVARAAAGGVAANTGSAAGLQGYSMKEGVREFNISKDNAVLAEGMASHQAAIYRQAGRTAMTSAIVGAVGAIGTGYFQSQQLAMGSLNVSPMGPSSLGAPVSYISGPTFA